MRDPRPSIPAALKFLRDKAALEFNAWHLEATRVEGLVLAWLHRSGSPEGPDGQYLMIYHEYAIPGRGELTDVARYIPEDLMIDEVAIVLWNTPFRERFSRKSFLLSLIPTSPRTPADACSACGKERTPWLPLFGTAQVCGVCATREASNAVQIMHAG